LERRGTLGVLDVPPDRDLLIRGVAAACGKAGRTVPAGLSLIAESDIPIARGLGSSAAATLDGAAAANALLGLELDREDLTALCADVEGHPDNVAPAVHGGAWLRPAATPPKAPRLAALVVHDSIALVFAVPDFTVETKRARAVLP